MSVGYCAVDDQFLQCAYHFYPTALSVAAIVMGMIITLAWSKQYMR